MSIHDDILQQYHNPIPLKPGGQKEVYKIKHDKYGWIVLKIGHPDANIDRIQREVDLLKGINSKYYPKLFEFRILDDNRFIILEEFMESRPLSECLDEFSDPEKALQLLKELVNGLTILWDKRVVHRDIKPANILISPDNTPIIIDLGIARALDMESLTQTLGLGPGTGFYAAREQFYNRKTEINHRTDQFQLGIVFTQILLDGMHPFSPDLVGGDSVPHNIINNLWYRDVLKHEKIKPMKSLIEHLLGAEPHQRYRSPKYLLESIDNCMEALS